MEFGSGSSYYIVQNKGSPIGRKRCAELGVPARHGGGVRQRGGVPALPHPHPGHGPHLLHHIGYHRSLRLLQVCAYLSLYIQFLLSQAFTWKNICFRDPRDVI